MKQFLILICLAFVGYWLYTTYEQNPDSLPQLHRALGGPAPTPTPAAPPPPPPPSVAPALDRVLVEKGETLTHAKVKNFTAVGVLFLADQGIFEIPYDRLPPDFAAYYVPRLPKPTPVPEGVTPTPTPEPTKRKAVQPARSADEDAQAMRIYDEKVKMLQDRLADAQAVMDKYHNQSSFQPTVTEQDFNNAQDTYNKTQALLNDVYSKGPL